MNPEVSVIIVTFNAAKDIEKAVNSFLSQTFDSKELIIIDGGSTDGTVNIIKKINAPQIRWISKPDKGIYDAMNKGIKMAKGEWLYFLGADDTFYNKDILRKIFSNSQNIDCDFLYGNVYSVDLERKYDGPFDKDRILFQNICHQAIFYKSSLYSIYGGYNKEYKTFADWDFNIKCFFETGIKIEYIDIIIANFAAGGLGTTNPDLFFLRSCLFQKNLWVLNKKGAKRLNNIVFYDKWWRLIRSLKLSIKENISTYSENEKLPLAILRMYSFQKRIPSKILWIGIFSKVCMAVSYLINLVSLKFE